MLTILDSQHTLESFLRDLRGRDLRFVTAFGCGTEKMLKQVAEHNTISRTLVGTINHFTDPAWIRALAGDPSINLRVDFRRQSSVHWKLILASPDTVIIGSANLTQLGVALTRDTCLVCEDTATYESYVARVERLCDEPNVLSASDPAFEGALRAYEACHERMQRSRSLATRGGAPVELSLWLADEANQSIPVFVWENHHGKKSDKHRDAIVRATTPKAIRRKPVELVRDYFTMPEEGECPYQAGDVVLCASTRGGYLGFYSFDIEAPVTEDGERRRYFISLKRSENAAPFALEPYAASLREWIRAHDDPSGIRVMHRDALRKLSRASGAVAY